MTTPPPTPPVRASDQTPTPSPATAIQDRLRPLQDEPGVWFVWSDHASFYAARNRRRAYEGRDSKAPTHTLVPYRENLEFRVVPGDGARHQVQARWTLHPLPTPDPVKHLDF